MGWPFLVTPFTSFRASSERSEGSVAMGREMLRCAQHDSAVAYASVDAADDELESTSWFIFVGTIDISTSSLVFYSVNRKEG